MSDENFDIPEYVEGQSSVLIYDIKSLPEGDWLDMDKILYFFRKQGVVLYDSEHGGRTPEVMHKNVKDIEVKFLDVSLQENQKKLNGYKKMIK